MSITLIQEGLKALREQIKIDPKTNRPTRGSVAKTAREVRKEIKRSKYLGPEDFNPKMLQALDPDKYSEYNDTPDTFSSDEGHYRPFKGINKDPDYFYNVPLGDKGIYTLETGERRQRRYPGAPTMPTIDPVVRDKDFSADDFSKFKNHSKRRTHYDI